MYFSTLRPKTLNSFSVSSIKIKNFRNYDQAQLSFDQQANVFTGLNGSGKTSLLDVINFLTLGKSGFAGTDKEVLKDGEDFFRIEGQLRFGTEESKIVIKYHNARKTLETDGVAQSSLKDFIGKFPSVCISPKDILIIIQGSLARRKLIDQTLSQQNKKYLNQLIQYKRILKQRNEALKAAFKSRDYNRTLFDTFNTQMIPLAKSIFEIRKAFAEEFDQIFRTIYNEISNQKEKCSIRYKSELHDEDFEYLLHKNWDRDKITQKTNTGIHKDDLTMILNGHNLRTFGSQGQQKTFVLALKLAQYEWLSQFAATKPILLLDDIFDKLDAGRVEALLNLINNKWKTQIFISDTDQDRISKLLNMNQIGHKCFTIENGIIQ